MSDLLDQLGSDTLPASVVDSFVRWCMLEQARPALVTVLEKFGLSNLATQVEATNEPPKLLTLATQIHAQVQALGAKSSTGPLGFSAAKAATYEFGNLMQAANENPVDAEAVAFFAARICGWAGWAGAGFGEPQSKASAELDARQTQEGKLQSLWQQSSPT